MGKRIHARSKYQVEISDVMSGLELLYVLEYVADYLTYRPKSDKVAWKVSKRIEAAFKEIYLDIHHQTRMVQYKLKARPIQGKRLKPKQNP